MTRFRTPRHREISNDAADSGSGWSLNFYVSGTTTRKDTFSDQARTTANANPVVADSAGRFGDIFLESGDYRVILTDENDVTIWDADPVAGAAGSAGAVDDVTSDTTLSLADNTNLKAVDASSTGITITLLDVATAGDGFEITVKKVDSSANTVTVDGNGAETIDGAATVVLRDQYETVTVRCDGDEWHIRDTGRFFSLIDLLTAETTSRDDDLIAVHDSSASAPRKMTLADAMRLPRGYLAGLQLSNGTDSDHEIDIAAGEARNDADDDDLYLDSPLTIDIEESGEDGLDTGSVASDTTYHVHLYEKPSDGVTHGVFSTSVDSPSLPDSATSSRRIGSVVTDGSSNIIAFNQLGDEFLLLDPPLDVDVASSGTTAVLRTLTVPSGIKVRAIVNAYFADGGFNHQIYLSSPDVNDEAPDPDAGPLASFGLNANTTINPLHGPMIVRTNTNSQIRARQTRDNAQRIATLGWLDTRGRDD